MKKALLIFLAFLPALTFAQCFITNLTVNVGGCDPGTNNFELSGQIQFTNPPTSGQLIVADCNGNQAVYNAPFTSPLSYSIPNIASDGTIGCNVSAYFTAIPSCSLTSPTYDNPTGCQCSTTIGTFSDNVTGGTNLTDPWYLCYGDVLNITGNGDFIPPQNFTPSYSSATYDPGLWLLLYSCVPYINPPNDITPDTCFLGVASTDNGVWDIINDIGDGSTFWYRPITMYSMTDGQYAVSINGGPWCFDVGPAYEVTFLEEIITTEVLDIGAGTITVTASGGMPALNGSSFTISNVSPVTATLSQSTVMNDSSFVISNLSSGQYYQYTLTDSAGCSVVFGNPDPFVGTDELGMEYLNIYPNPTTGTFTVKSSFEGEFLVRDLAGRFITEGKLNEEVDLSKEPAGVYLIHVNNRVYRVQLTH